MEATALQEEEINVARPSGSIIQIKAISIDLMFPNKPCTNFQHNFSIRGYAAEMKTKNPKACNPFSSDGFNDFEEQLPPLHTYQNNLDVQSETTQDSMPLSKDIENLLDSSNVAVAGIVDAETEIVEAAVEIDAGDMPLTENETVALEGINVDTENVPVLNEFQKGESSGLLPEERMNSVNNEQIINAETGNLVQNIDEDSVAEPEDSVHEAENMNNAALSDSEWSEGHVPSSNLSRRKVRKVRLLSDLLSEKGTIVKTVPVREYSSTTSSKSLEPTEAETSRSHDQNLHDDDGTDSTGPHTKETFHQEEEILSSVRGKSAAKSDAEPTVKRRVIPSSGSGLWIGNKADRLKRKIEKNQSLSKKKRKTSQVFDAFPSNKPLLKSVNMRNDDLKRCNMPVSRSFGSSSAAGEPTNSSHDYQSARETDRYRNNFSQTPSQIPNSTAFNDWSSRKGPLTLDRYQHKIGGSSRNPDSVETDIHIKKKKKKKKKNNFRFAEGGIPSPSGEVLMKNKQVLDLNERATHNSSYEFAKGSFPMPKERDFFHHCEQDKLYENQGPSKLVSEQRKHRDGKAAVQSSTDDIPMEIVELMAKNQYERTLGNTGSHLGSFRTYNTMRTFPELQDTRNMERPAAIGGYSGLTSFGSPNVRSGMNLPTGSVNYSQMGRNHYNMGQVERSLSMYDAFPQNQRQFSATPSVRTGPQHSGDVVGPSMLSRFGLGSVQNFSVSPPESSHKGKTISDIKADELKKTQEARSFVPKPVEFEFNDKLKGSLDPYANDNIPALQLLSLMDERSPGTPFNAGTSRMIDHSQTPGFLNGFLRNNHARENYGLAIGAHNSAESSGQRPFTFSGSLSLESQKQDRSREKVHIFGSGSDVSNSGGGQTSYRGKDKQKAVALYSESDDSHMETESGQESIKRLRTLPPNEICVLNRNPADFSVPEAGNEFTISGKDFKFRKKRKHWSSRPWKPFVHNDGTKQQRKEKAKFWNETGIMMRNEG